MLEGHVENGKVVMDEPLTLPDGTAVSVEPSTPVRLPPKSKAAFWQDFLSFAGTITDLPPDASMKVDEYLYEQELS